MKNTTILISTLTGLLGVNAFAEISTIQYSAGMAITDCKGTCTIEFPKTTNQEINLIVSKTPTPPGLVGEKTIKQPLSDGSIAYSHLEVVIQKKNVFTTVNVRLIGADGKLLCGANAMKSGKLKRGKADIALYQNAVCRLGDFSRIISVDYKN